MSITWFEPRFGREELIEIESVIKNNYVNEGPKTREFEELIKDYLDVSYVLFTTNATAALFLSIKAEAILRKVNNFEVIVPDTTMFATASAVNWAGGKPILVDVKDNLTIDPLKILEKITPKTIAIIPVHVLGRAAEMDKILKIAEENNLAIIEDAAGALGSKYYGKYLGTIGKVGCFSLQSNKIITSGQGGIIVTNDKDLYETMRRLRDFGRLNNKEFLHNTIGFNLKFNDLSAAIGIAQFKKIDQRKNLLINQYNQYLENLSNLNEINFFKFKKEEVPLWIDATVKHRESLSNFLKSNEIFTRNCWPALHRNPPYNHLGRDIDFPKSSFASDNVLWLPNGPGVSEKDIDLICNKIKEFYLR